MANLKVVNGNVLVTVHGRGSVFFGMRFPLSKDAEGVVTYMDMSQRDIWFEIRDIDRKPVDRMEGQPEWIFFKLSRTEVEALKEGSFSFIFVDETDPDFPEILWQGDVKQVGWEGVPNKNV